MFDRLRNIAAFFSLAIALAFSSPVQSRDVRVGLIELRVEDVGNFAIMKMLAEEAKNQGAELVIYPEASDLGWLNPAAFTNAEPIPGRYSAAFADIALELGLWIATGLTEKGPKAGPGSRPDAFYAYDAGILINPDGEIVLHHRQFNVVRNAFDPTACQAILNQAQCSYTPGAKEEIKIVKTPFGRTALLVCADAYTYAPATALERLKTLSPDFVIVPWGITAAAQNECGTKDFNATSYASEAANYLKSAFVVGANAIGERRYGRFLPSLYCGDSGYATPTGDPVTARPVGSAVLVIDVPGRFEVPADPIIAEADAARLCPSLCGTYASDWTRQWKKTSADSAGRCGCVADTSQ